MTLFYSKRTGEIKAYTSGEIDFGYFGEDKEDMEIIYNCLITDLDEYVIENIEKFHIENGEIRIKEDEIPDRFL